MPARTKSTTTTTTEKNNIEENVKEVDVKIENSKEKIIRKPVIEPFSPEKKVTVRSIADWDTGFKRIESIGDVQIPANGSVRLSASEIVAQVQNGNTLFRGNDGCGSHATLYIDDKATRIEADFETEDTTQKFITNELVKQLFSEKLREEFEKGLRDLVVTRAERYTIINIIRKEKLFNDYEKVRAVEDYTGLRV